MRIQPYPSYRATSIEWLPQVPDHWCVKRLKFACSCNDETLSEATSPDYEFDYIEIGNVSLVSGVVAKEHLTFEKAPSRARRVVRGGDAIVSTVRTYLRAVATIEKDVRDVIVSTGFAVLRSRGELDGRYLGYFVQADGFVGEIVSRSTGVSYPAILATELVTIPIVIPPLAEQKAIVSYLDDEIARIDALISGERQLLAALEEKRLAIITNAVTRGLNPEADVGAHNGLFSESPSRWNVMRLKFLTPGVTVGIVVKPADHYVDHGVVTLRGFNIRERNIDLSDVVHISRASNELHAKSKIFAGDLVAVRTGQPGTTAVVPSELDGTNCVDLIIIRRSEAMESDFLAYFANSDPAKTQYGSGSEGALQQHFNIETAKNLVVPVPPLDEQRSIIKYLRKEESKIDEVATKISEAVERLTEYRSALITNAVTGKVDLRSHEQREAAE